MRILFVTRSTVHHAGAGGMEVHARQVWDGLAERGHELEVLTTAHPDGTAAITSGPVTIHFLAGTPAGRYSAAWSRACADWIERRLARQPVDVILAQSGAAHDYLRHARQDSHPPIVMICHGIALWTLQARIRNLAGLAQARALASALWTYLAEKVREGVRRVLYDTVICVSEPLSRAYVQDNSYPPERVVTVANGIETARFAPDETRRRDERRALGLDDAQTAALLCGRLDREKGFDLAIRALERLSPAVRDRVVLVVAGDGPAREELEAAARACRAPGAVKLLGRVERERMPALHGASDVHAFPTLLDEPCPLTILEAMAAGRPVIAPLTGGIPMLVEDGVEGLAMRSGDVDGLARALETLATDGATRARLGAGALAKSQRFTLERMVGGIEEVLVRLVRGGRSRPV